MKEEHAALRERCNKLETEKGELEDLIKSKQDENKEITEELEALKKQLNDANSAKDSLERQIAKLQSEIDEHQKGKDCYLKEGAEQIKQIEELRHALTET